MPFLFFSQYFWVLLISLMLFLLSKHVMLIQNAPQCILNSSTFSLYAFLDYGSVCTQTGGHCQRVGWKSGQASGQMVCCYWMLLIGCVIPLYKDWCDFTVGHICMVTNMWKHDIYYSRTSFEKVWLMQTPLGVRMEGRMDAEEESLASSS